MDASDIPARDTFAPLAVQVADAAQPALMAWRRRGLSGTVELRSPGVPANVPSLNSRSRLGFRRRH